MIYNADGSDFFKLAHKWDKRFEKDIQKVVKRYGPLSQVNSTTKIKGPSIEEKASFCRMMYEINENQLGKIVKMLDDICEKALDKTNADEVEINVDVIDIATFKKLESQIKEFQAENQAESKKRPGDDATSVNEAKKPKA